KADPDRPAIGRVIEAHLDKGRGPVATVLVQTGTLERGDLVVAGTTFGKVRAMVDDKGTNIGRAEPSRPVEILGLPEVPEAGDVIRAVADEKAARALAAQNARERAASTAAEKPATLDEMFAQVKEGKAKELKIVLKADVQGSLEAIKTALGKIPQNEVTLAVIHDAVGDITESDLTLAAASGAVVVGFNTKMEAPARRVADSTKVDVRLYKVIYELLDDVQKALTGMLEPELVESTLGHAEVLQLFTAGKTTIAGSRVVDGLVRRGAQASVLGDGEAAKGTMAGLEDAKKFLRHQIGERTDLRFVPELTFVPDRSAERAVRIAGLLREARERKSGRRTSSARSARRSGSRSCRIATPTRTPSDPPSPSAWAWSRWASGSPGTARTPCPSRSASSKAPSGSRRTRRPTTWISS